MVIIVIVLMIVTILLVMLWSVLEDLSLTSTPLSPSLPLSLTRLKWRRRTRATPYTKDDLLGEPDDSLHSPTAVTTYNIASNHITSVHLVVMVYCLITQYMRWVWLRRMKATVQRIKKPQRCMRWQLSLF